MMGAYETFGNQTYLQEAEVAAKRLATGRGADEFFMTYELPMANGSDGYAGPTHCPTIRH